MKKLLQVIVSVILVFSLAACGGSSQPSETPNATPAPSNTPAPEQPKGSEGSGAASEIDKDNKDPITVTLAGGSVGGFWSGLGQVISASFAASYPGSAATYEPGSGAGNIKLISENQVEIGLVQSVEIVAAVNGIDPFPQKYENLQALAAIYDNALMQVTVRKAFAEKHGISSLEELAAKKVPANIAINQKGNVNSGAAYTMLESYGITEETLRQWGGSLTWAGSAQRFEAMQNGRADISVDFVFAPDSKVQETTVHTPLEMWGVNENALKALKEKWDLPESKITKGTYDWLEADVTTVSLSAIILVSDKVSETQQYKMAKALVDNLETIKAFHPAMKNASAEMFATTHSTPLAPGAEAYFKEIGALK